VSEKLSLGDSIHEQLKLEIEMIDGQETTTAAARRARSDLTEKDKSRTVWVGGIPDKVIADSANAVLTDVFKPFGAIASITTRQKAGSNNSWAFIVFEDAHSARAAIEQSAGASGVIIPAEKMARSGRRDVVLNVTGKTASNSVVLTQPCLYSD
jgi:hypothetical protein